MTSMGNFSSLCLFFFEMGEMKIKKKPGIEFLGNEKNVCVENLEIKFNSMWLLLFLKTKMSFSLIEKFYSFVNEIISHDFVESFLVNFFCIKNMS